MHWILILTSLTQSGIATVSQVNGFVDKTACESAGKTWVSTVSGGEIRLAGPEDNPRRPQPYTYLCVPESANVPHR